MTHSEKSLKDELSKKKKMHARIEEDEELVDSKKKKLTNCSKSNTKISIERKSEVHFSNEITEIKENININKGSEHNTPIKSCSSQHRLKNVKEHVLTPYSKVKENPDSDDDCPTPKFEEKNLKLLTTPFTSSKKAEKFSSLKKNLLSEKKKIMSVKKISFEEKVIEIPTDLNETKEREGPKEEIITIITSNKSVNK